MAKIEKLVPLIKKWEGGFSNHPNDKGGATMAGITIATYTAYKKAKKLPAPTVDQLKNISDEEWMDVLKTMYWDKCKADDIKDESIALLIVDWFWTSGKWAIVFTQRILGLGDDGIVGPKTIAAINNYSNQEELFNKLWERRKKHFESLANQPGQSVFLKGWLNRLNDFKYNK